jgi:hypothetical protein
MIDFVEDPSCRINISLSSIGYPDIRGREESWFIDSCSIIIKNKFSDDSVLLKYSRLQKTPDLFLLERTQSTPLTMESAIYPEAALPSKSGRGRLER